MDAARCAWEVTAGLIPGEPMPEYTRRWTLLSKDYHESPAGLANFNAALVGATEYARFLMHPQQLNWVKVEWVWF